MLNSERNRTMQELDRLAHDIALHGIHHQEEQMRRLADWAVRSGVHPAIAGILADPDAPPVARERAFARVSAAARLHQSLDFVA
jgi:hypothetical protein